MYCESCGAEMADGATYCRNCGLPQAEVGGAKAPAKKSAAGGGPSLTARLGVLALFVVASWVIPNLISALETYPSVEAYYRYVTAVTGVAALTYVVWAAVTWGWFLRSNVLVRLVLGVVGLLALQFVLYGSSLGISFLAAPALAPALSQLRQAVYPGAPGGGQASLPPVPTAVIQQPPAVAAYTATPAPTMTPPPVISAPTPTTGGGAGQAIATMYVSAGGDGVYVRRTPFLSDKYKAWPDGTTMQVYEYAPVDWARVKAPDGYLGYVPRQYLASSPPAPRLTSVPVAPRAFPTPSGRMVPCGWVEWNRVEKDMPGSFWGASWIRPNGSFGWAWCSERETQIWVSDNSWLGTP